jgi:hypothetical protein
MQPTKFELVINLTARKRWVWPTPLNLQVVTNEAIEKPGRCR